jgi:hypothetical protein
VFFNFDLSQRIELFVKKISKSAIKERRLNLRRVWNLGHCILRFVWNLSFVIWDLIGCFLEKEDQ